MSALPNGGFAWRAKPWLVPGTRLDEYKALVQPLLDEWADIGVDPKITYFEYDNIYDAWSRHFPVERVGSPYARTASRLIPRENWADAEIANKTIKTVRSVVEDGAFLVHYNINADAPDNTADSAANPAWRDVMMFAIIGLIWDQTTTAEEIASINDKLTNDLGQRLEYLARMVVDI